MTGARFTVEQKVTMYFESLRPRYRPFCMYQYCTWCGKEYPRSAYGFKRIAQCTVLTCKYCNVQGGRSIKPKGEPIPWESREMMLERLILERGVGVQVGSAGQPVVTVYKQTAEHRARIAESVAQLAKKKAERDQAVDSEGLTYSQRSYIRRRNLKRALEQEFLWNKIRKAQIESKDREQIREAEREAERERLKKIREE